MTEPRTNDESDPEEPAPAQRVDLSPGPRHPARKWIVATVVLGLAAIGLGVWALSLRSDVEDKDAQIAAQQQQLDEEQDVAGQARDAASRFAADAQQALRELGDELEQVGDAAAATREETQQAIERAEQAGAEASDRVDEAGDEVERARAEADEAAARAEAAGACARGYISAIAGAVDAESIDAGVEQAREDIEALSGSCEGTLGS
jgi:DNA repair exonuclease SbcCD ATPase subunit